MSSNVGFTGGRQVVEFRPSGDYTWTRQAACTAEDEDLMFPDDGNEKAIEAAKQVCRRCPVSDACLQDAVERGERHGVRGGMTSAERNLMKRRAANQRYRNQSK